jgi:hypothetical protein
MPNLDHLSRSCFLWAAELDQLPTLFRRNPPRALVEIAWYVKLNYLRHN